MRLSKRASERKRESDPDGARLDGDLPPAERDLLNYLRARDDTPRADPRYVNQLGADLLARRRMAAARPAPRAAWPRGAGFWASRAAVAAALCLLLLGAITVGNAVWPREVVAPRVAIPVATEGPTALALIASPMAETLRLNVDHPPRGPLLVRMGSATLPAGANVPQRMLTADGGGIVLVVSGALTVQSTHETIIAHLGTATASGNAGAAEIGPGDAASFLPTDRAVFANDGKSPVRFVYALLGSASAATTPVAGLALQPVGTATLPQSSGPLMLTLSVVLIDPGAGVPPNADVRLAVLGSDASAALAADWRNPGPGQATVYVVAVTAAPAASPTPATPRPTATARPTRAATRTSKQPTATAISQPAGESGDGAPASVGGGADQPSDQSGGQPSTGQSDGQPTTGQGDVGNASQSSGNASGNAGQSGGQSGGQPVGNTSGQTGSSGEDNSTDSGNGQTQNGTSGNSGEANSSIKANSSGEGDGVQSNSSGQGNSEKGD